MAFKNKEIEKAWLKEYYIKNREKIKEKSRLYRIENQEEVNKKKRQYYKENPEKKKESDKKSYIKNIKKRKEYQKQYYIENRDILIEKTKQWIIDNPKKSKEGHKKWIIKNKEKRRKYINKWYNQKLKIDLKYNLNSKIGHAIYKSLRRNKASYHWEILTGYALIDLIKRLNKTMPEGYTWQDYLKGELHIDHIIPISAFNFTKPKHTDFKRCWSLGNLRLLPAKENLIKHNKLDKPFQPSLAF